MKKILVIFAVYLLPLISKAQQDSYLVPFSFTISETLTTSAGVYAADGTLIKTLWNNVSYTAGTYNKTWDGLDDDGLLVKNANYKIVVQTNKVKYEWEGASIGNTSTNLTGPEKFRSFRQIVCMSVTAGKAYYGTGYSEKYTSAFTFNLDNIGKKTNILNNGKTNQDGHYVWSDNKNVYWAGVDPYSVGGNTHFIYATAIVDNSEVTDFQYGVKLKMAHGREYKSVLDVFTNASGVYHGLTGMVNGNYIFVAQPLINTIKVFKKYPSGQLVQTIKTFVNPRYIACDQNKGLWIVHGKNKVEKYTINANGTLSAKPVIVIDGLLQPLALAVSPDNKVISICDGETSEQVKSFSNTTGLPVWTLGEAGGYTKSPLVNDNKFYFLDRNKNSDYPFPTSFSTLRAFITYAPDGSFWVMDPGNYRVQHYSKDRKFLDRIMSLPRTYSVQADPNDPTKVFNQFLEFKIDYSKPLAGNNGSWSLVRNYRATVPNEYFENQMYSIFNSVTTLKNGKTYAFLKNVGSKTSTLVELPKDKPFRITNISFNANENIFLRENGDLTIYRKPSIGPGGDARLYLRKLSGFDTSNNPIWGLESQVYKIPSVSGKDPVDFGGRANQGQMTTSGLLISFDRNGYQKTKNTGNGYHLGAIKPSDDKFLWKTAKSTYKDYSGDFPNEGSFDIGNYVNPNSAGGDVYVNGNQIFYNYQGEFWKNSQTNYWNQFSDIGLMVGQFGTHRVNGGPQSPWGMAGNVMSGNLVKHGDNLYIYHCDEATHSGVHRWKITGVNTIKQIDIPVALAIKSNGLSANYYSGIDLDNTNLKAQKIDTTINFNWKTTSPDKTNLNTGEKFSGVWSGFVMPLFSETYTFYVRSNDGVRLWVDGKLLINKWQDKSTASEYSGNISLMAGKRYSIRIEHYKKTGDNVMTLSWKSTKQNKQVIPSVNLFPSEPEDPSKGINLMEGLKSNDILKDGMYGWNRNSKDEDSTKFYVQWWSVKTGVKSFKTPDVYMLYRQPSGAKYSVTRNLGNVSVLTTQWNLSGNIKYEGNVSNKDGWGGSYIEVLDDSGKIITRIFPSTQNGAATFNVNDLKNPLITKSNSRELAEIMDEYQDIKITGNKTGITVKYGSYSPITTTIFDPSSNWQKPKTLRFYFYSETRSFDKKISAEGFRFITTEENEESGAIKKTQNIQFANIEEQVYGDTLTLNATASSGLPTSYVVKSGPAKVEGDQLVFNGVGDVTLEARQNGNGKFLQAPVSTQKFNVTKATQVIKLGNPAYKQVTYDTFQLYASASSTLPVTFIVSGKAKIKGSLLSLTGFGKTEIKAVQAGNENYLPAKNIAVNVSISEIAVKIDFPEIADQKINEPFYLNAKASSGLLVAYKVLSGPAEISGNKVTFTGAGRVEIGAYLSGNESKGIAVVREFNVTGLTSLDPLGFPAGKNNDMPDKEVKATLDVYPNPASTGTHIKYLLQNEMPSKIQIYNTQGVLIKSFENQPNEAGISNEVWFDTTQQANGIYIVRLISAKNILSKKLIVVK